ncbi:NIF3-like protein 1 isoform X1 [Centruroides vittatus]|uniref:NIF3-like protein 1 isoform X1 n=2 Tax=Centruroides vittatus TaxID=120091 RepID=UPI00350FA09C
MWLKVLRIASKGKLFSGPRFIIQKRNMELSSVVRELEKLAPLSLAEKWDNVGLLVESSENSQVNKILLTNDLTESVLLEAVEKKIDLIVSYHPPIFKPLKSLTCKNWKENLIIKCIQSYISVYSPHTAFDAVAKGVNDWLIQCFDMDSTKPIHQSYMLHSKFSHHVKITFPTDSNIEEKLMLIQDTSMCTLSVNEDVKTIKISTDNLSLMKIVEIISPFPDILKTVEIHKVNEIPAFGYGMGRFGILKKPTKINDIINTLKQYLGLKHLRVALGNNHSLDSQVKTISTCAGAGSSVLESTRADLFITGEMSHHFLLDATQKNITVILCEHSNSERGYLKQFSELLSKKLENVTVLISELDRDPILIT